jgi:DNA repair exonuclease SbcCD ATPase subunit
VNLKNIKFNNIFSYKEGQLIFDNKVYLVLGMIDGKLTCSNGAGKTSIINIIHKAIYDKTLKRNIKDISMNHSGNMNIEISFDNKKIVRGMINGKNYEKLFVDNEQQIEKKTNFTDDFIDYELFKLITTFTPKYNFFSLDDSKRKDLIISLTNNDIIDKVYEKVSKDLKQIEEKNFDILIENYKKSLENKEEFENKFIKVEKTLKRYEKVEEALNKLIMFERNRKTLFEDYFVKKEDFFESKNKGNNLSNLYKKIEDINLDKYVSDMSKYQSNIDNEEDNIESLKKKMKMVTDGKCPICRQKISNKQDILDDYQKDIDSSENEIEKNQKLLDNMKKEYSKLKEKKSANDDIKMEYEKIKVEFKQKKEKYINLRFGILKLYEEFSIYFKYKNSDITLRDINNTKMEYGELKQKVSNLEEVENRLREAQENKIKNDLMIDDLKEIKNIFSKNGIKQFIIQKVTDFLITRINELLIKVYEDWKINIKLDFSEKRNTMDIEIYKGDKIFNFEELSTGQGRILEIIFQIALTDLFELVNGDSINIAFFDETFDALDEDNISKISNIIKILEETGKTVLIISHNEKVKQYFNNFIIVEQNDGISKLTQGEENEEARI